MPDRFNLGFHAQSVILMPLTNWQDAPKEDRYGRRMVMGYALPEWQRDLVWSRDQMIKLLESLWMGLNIGTFTYNQCEDSECPLDNLLIDGQQRMYALQCYLEDQFPVFGYHWSEVTKIDQRRFKTRHFQSYRTQSYDEEYLKTYYDLMNFGGVAHKPEERAIKPEAPGMKP